MQQPVTMVRGTTHTIIISLKDPAGNPRTLAADEVLRFGLKRFPEDNTCLITKELTTANADENGDYLLILVPSDTINLEIGTHYYDVGLQNGTTYDNVIPCSPFKIGANISEAVINA